MSKILISNPFLFPPSGDNEEENQLLETRKEIVKNYITYSLKEFEKAWKTAGEEDSNKSSDLWGKIFPETELPQATLFSHTMANTLDLDAMLSEQFQYDDSDFPFSPIFNNLGEKDDLKQDNLLDKTNEALHSIGMHEPESNTMYGFVAMDNEKSADSQASQPQQSSSQESLSNDFCNGTDITFDILSYCGGEEGSETPTINGADALSLGIQNQNEVKDVHPSAMQIERMEFHQSTEIEPEPVMSQMQPEPASTVPIKTRPRRKSAQTSRNIQDSIVIFPEGENSYDLRSPATNATWAVPATPELKPLANLNGGRINSVPVPSPSASTSSCVIKTEPQSPLPCTPAKKSVGKSNTTDARRKRKYEEEDVNDPSVKNAKAAKMNRDKKKQQMQDLQRQVQDLQTQNSNLNLRLVESETEKATLRQQSQEEIARLTRELNEERSKNSANAMQKVTMLHYIKAHIQANASLNRNQTPVVTMSQRVAEMPMPAPEEVQRLLSIAPGLGQSAPIQGNPGFLTFKVGLGAVPSLHIDTENNDSRNQNQNFHS